MEGNAAKLHSEGSLTPVKMNLLVLIMQLIIFSKYISSWMTSSRSYYRYKFADLNDGIRPQVVQMNSKFAQNVQKHWMRWHTESSSKKVFKDDSFVGVGLRH
jgi:hypothetical protein